MKTNLKLLWYTLSGIAAFAFLVVLLIHSPKRSLIPPKDIIFVDYTETTNNLNIEMVFVQGGMFTKAIQYDSYDCEIQTHQVTVSSFYIGKYEITQEQWKAIMGSNSSAFRGDNLPMENVSWNDVQKFICRLNEQTGKQYRLPTETEWEFAARGGNQSKNYKYSGGNKLDDVAWYYDNSDGSTHPVGTKQPNELHIYDMNGNVWEWCSDWYGLYTSSIENNPQGPSSGSDRLNRGGSWNDGMRSECATYRSGDSPCSRYGTLGFRLAGSLN